MTKDGNRTSPDGGGESRRGLGVSNLHHQTVKCTTSQEPSGSQVMPRSYDESYCQTQLTRLIRLETMLTNAKGSRAHRR